jgi:hypothetical protein
MVDCTLSNLWFHSPLESCTIAQIKAARGSFNNELITWIKNNRTYTRRRIELGSTVVNKVIRLCAEKNCSRTIGVKQYTVKYFELIKHTRLLHNVRFVYE